MDTEGKFEIDEEDFEGDDLNVTIKDNTLVISVRSDASVLEPGATFWYDIPVRYVKDGEWVATKVYTVVRCNHIAKETGRVWPSCGSSGYVNYKCETCGYTWRRVWVPVMDIAGTAELSQKNRPAVQMESKHIPVQTVEVPIRK